MFKKFKILIGESCLNQMFAQTANFTKPVSNCSDTEISKTARHQCWYLQTNSTPPPFTGEGSRCSLFFRKRKKNKYWLTFVTCVICLDMCKLSTLFTHQNGNSVIAGKGRATENVVDTFKRKCPHLGKIRSPENIVQTLGYVPHMLIFHLNS